MSSFARTLITLDMLNEEMTDEIHLPAVQQSGRVTPHYLKLLTQYRASSQTLEELASALTENGFIESVKTQNVCLHLLNKRVLMVQNKLLGYAIDFYGASEKADRIRHDEFNEQADIRFDLLSTRAIKLKSQFRTVAKAMKRRDYESLIKGIGLAKFDWGWGEL